MAEPHTFDIGGPLPRGLGVLEASAGTGKTYALSALAVRYIAEADVPASGLCIVSFAEAATAELRGRVRARLVEAVAHLERGDDPGNDPVWVALCAGTDADRSVRLERLRRAVADFDAATIATIHGLCRRVLTMAGVEVDGGISDGLAEIEEVVNDLVVARYGHDPDHLVQVAHLVEVVRLALALPDAELFVPEGGVTWRRGNPDRQAHEFEQIMRVRDTVSAAVAEVIRRRALHRRSTFDGLLTETRAALAGPLGASLVAQLRERYQVVLIDEFQDTDRVQWDIFSRAFVAGGRSPTSVVLVGDPKQSIYRFRSADLGAYLDAVAAAGDQVWSLDVNWRSDGPLLAALDRLFSGLTFGDPRVPFRSVQSSAGRDRARLAGASIEIRDVVADPPTAPTARRMILADVVSTIASLLADGTEIDDPVEGPRPVRARDIAVLTRSNVDAALLALRLNAAGVPAATASSQSVMETDAARQWRVLLRALERPGATGTARAAALGWFVGWSVQDVAALDDDDGVADLHDLLVSWSEAMASGGLPRLLAAVRAHGLHERLLSRPDGQRLLTDLDHIAELLQSRTAGARVGATAFLACFDALCDPDGAEAMASDALSRRIDRDDDAVGVLTVHAAKGLEYGIVLCPFLWTAPRPSGPRHCAVEGGRAIDCSWLITDFPSKNRKVTLRAADAEENAGEALRLVYVALTRARHRLVVWFPTGAAQASPLRHLLESAVGDRVDETSLQTLHGACDGALEVGSIDGSEPRVVVPAAAPPTAVLAVAEARRSIGDRWRPWSFSGVKREADLRLSFAQDHVSDSHDAPPLIGGTDEPSADEPGVDGSSTDGSGDSPLARAPGGTEFGTLVHEVLEVVDFTSASLLHDLTSACADRLRYRRLAIMPHELAGALLPALAAPLGGPEGDRRLVDISRRDRLDELDFHLPLAGVRADRLGAVLARHLPDGDPFAAWATGLGAEGYDIDIEGLMTGSIDLVGRSADGRRFWLADYKTNQLGRTSRYDQAEMVDAMIHHHYPLQAALYLVALHRYLKWRVADYSPQDQLVGAAYLFVRGMRPDADAAGPHVPGVVWWQPPVAAIDALDRFLATGVES
jgi:exodeoxyribonuclease V beta subunit